VGIVESYELLPGALNTFIGHISLKHL
jgi:hypothetical protein